MLRVRSKPGSSRSNASLANALDVRIAPMSSADAATGNKCSDCSEPVATRTAAITGSAIGVGLGVALGVGLGVGVTAIARRNASHTASDQPVAQSMNRRGNAIVHAEFAVEMRQVRANRGSGSFQQCGNLSIAVAFDDELQDVVLSR